MLEKFFAVAIFLIWLVVFVSFGFSTETESTPTLSRDHPITGHQSWSFTYEESHINTFGYIWLSAWIWVPIVITVILSIDFSFKKKEKSIDDYKKYRNK